MAASTKTSAPRKVTVELTKILWAKQWGCGFKGKVVESEKPEAVGKVLTCKGKCHELVEGARYILEGKAVWEEKFNEWQMVFDSYTMDRTANLVGLQNYLAKECDHIGPGRAEQMVTKYGAETWEILKEHPARLVQDIVGINIFLAQEIQVWAKAEEALAPVKKKMYEVGLMPGLIARLLEAYGTNTENVIRENVFSLTEIKGIGFLTADKVAMKFGMLATNPLRVKEGVLYTLQAIMDDQGHTCIRHDILINETVKLLKIHKQYIIDAINQMLAADELCTQQTDPRKFSRNPSLFEEGSELDPIELL